MESPHRRKTGLPASGLLVLEDSWPIQMTTANAGHHMSTTETSEYSVKQRRNPAPRGAKYQSRFGLIWRQGFLLRSCRRAPLPETSPVPLERSSQHHHKPNRHNKNNPTFHKPTNPWIQGAPWLYFRPASTLGMCSCRHPSQLAEKISGWRTRRLLQ